MNFEFIRDENNGLLNRQEVEFVLTFDGATPSRREIMGKLCALRNVAENCVVLDSIKQGFGKQELRGALRIYDDEETRNKVELAHLIERTGTEPEPAEETAANKEA